MNPLMGPVSELAKGASTGNVNAQHRGLSILPPQGSP